MKYPIAPDFRSLRFIVVPIHFRWSLRLSVAGSRMGFSRAKPRPGMHVDSTTCTSKDGRKVPIEIYRPDVAPKSNAPCLVYFHGGGFVLPAAPHHRVNMFRYATEAKCVVIHVDYALAPAHPFPAGLDDCLAAFRYAVATAQTLGIDSARIAVGGDSAGGAFAADISHITRDEKTRQPCLQMLIYPVTDNRKQTESSQKFDDTPVWNAKLSKIVGRYYFTDAKRKQPTPPMAFPTLAERFDHLAPAYVETAEFDPLRDEGIAYAKTLEAAGVDVVLNETKGTVHGFDMVYDSPISKAALAARYAALRQAFGT